MTYAILALIVLAGALVVHIGCRAIAVRRGTLPTRFGLAVLTAGIALTVMTIIFDSLMIAAELVTYEAEHLTGIFVWLAPVEDLAWPLAAVLVLPAVWIAIAPRPDADQAEQSSTQRSSTKKGTA